MKHTFRLLRNNDDLQPLILQSEFYSKKNTTKIFSNISNHWDVRMLHVKMPRTSHFGFKIPPNNLKKWKEAQKIAASGENILLQKILKHFPEPRNFLDGDIRFRQITSINDISVDNYNDHLNMLTSTNKVDYCELYKLRKNRSQLQNMKQKNDQKNENTGSVLSSRPPINGYRNIEIMDPENYVPCNDSYRKQNRAPIVGIGYYIFNRSFDSNEYYTGPVLGHANMMKRSLLQKWKEIKHVINTPFIISYIADENTGPFSTYFPNRTDPRNPYFCCDSNPWDRELLRPFLDDEHLLLLISHQNNNISHPKILTLPRGLPVTREKGAERALWLTMKHAAVNVKKRGLLYTASSSWNTRPQIVACVGRKVPKSDFYIHFSDKSHKSDKSGKKSIPVVIDTDQRVRYYETLAAMRFGLALPGLGYDCFRTWEMLTMGTIPVIERGVGLDRSLWRLPALLVDDFADITPELLRSAYVEAIYRADEFEFERLTQSFWIDLIHHVSITKSSQRLYELFPMTAEDLTFTRPLIPYNCTLPNTCGKGTKRTPKEYC